MGTCFLLLPKTSTWISAFKRRQGGIDRQVQVGIDQLLNSPKELKKYFDLSYAYAKTLKPKPTSKTKAAKQKTK